MANGKYETALMTLIPTRPKEWTSSHVALIAAANHIDYLTDTIIRDSESMAKKFTNFANEMATRGDGWSPMGYSTLRDLEVNIAKLEVNKNYFITLLRLAFGPKGHVTFRDALEATDNVAA